MTSFPLLVLTCMVKHQRGIHVCYAFELQDEVSDFTSLSSRKQLHFHNNADSSEHFELLNSLIVVVMDLGEGRRMESTEEVEPADNVRKTSIFPPSSPSVLRKRDVFISKG